MTGGALSSYSPSALDLFEKCPLAFRYRYVDRIPDPLAETLEQYMGKTVHSTLEWVHKRAADGAPPMWHEILEDFHGRYDRGWSDDIRIVNPHRSREGHRSVGERCLRNYFEANTPFDSGSLVGTEWEFRFMIDERAGRPWLTGRIDRVSRNENGLIEIHDYKTGAHVPPRQELERSRQAMIYALAARHAYPQATNGRVQLVWHYLQSAITVPFEIRESALASRSQVIMMLITEIESTTDYKARPSRLCPWCEYGRICPEFCYREQTRTTAPAHGKNIGGPDLVDRLQRLGALHREIEKAYRAERRAVEKALVEHARENGIATVPGTGVEAVIGADSTVHIRKRKDVD